MIYGFDGAYSKSFLTQETCRFETKARGGKKATLILLIIQRKACEDVEKNKTNSVWNKHSHMCIFKLTGFHLAAAASMRICQSCSTIITWRLSMMVISYLLIPHLNPLSSNPGTYSKCVSTIKLRFSAKFMNNMSVNTKLLLFVVLTFAICRLYDDSFPAIQ